MERKRKFRVEGHFALEAYRQKQRAIEALAKEIFGEYPLWIALSETENKEVFRLSTGSQSKLVNAEFTKVYE